MTNPLKAFNFKVLIDGVEMGGWKVFNHSPHTHEVLEFQTHRWRGPTRESGDEIRAELAALLLDGAEDPNSVGAWFTLTHNETTRVEDIERTARHQRNLRYEAVMGELAAWEAWERARKA